MKPFTCRIVCCVLIAQLVSVVGCAPSADRAVDKIPADWTGVVTQARGTTVRVAMWDGDPMINAYMRELVAPAVEDIYGIRIETVGLRGNPLVSKLMVELEAGRTIGDIDLVWINGENFYQLRQLDALYGPFTDRLPNSPLIDWDDPFIAYDFQQPVSGFECPWGSVQQAIIYHSERISEPPQNPDALAAWIRAHPGRFTIDTSFTGMTFVKALLIHFSGDRTGLQGAFDEAAYRAAADELFAYLRALRPYFWKQGETYPEDVAQLHQLFANNEVDFTFSNNDGEVDNKVLQGVLPPAARGYVWETGTIRNSHYMGIPSNAPNPSGAMVVTNALIAPETQWEKAKPAVWGDGTVLDVSRLEPAWQAAFAAIPGRTRVPPRETIAPLALLEPAPEVMMRLYDDFRRQMIEAQ